VIFNEPVAFMPLPPAPVPLIRTLWDESIALSTVAMTLRLGLPSKFDMLIEYPPLVDAVVIALCHGAFPADAGVHVPCVQL